MTATILSATNIGFEGKLIEVECDTSNGLPILQIVGLGNKAIDEAKERVRSAIKNSGLDFPKKRITINLAPANLPKNGAHFDLPIAIALLVVSGQLPAEAVQNVLFAGELALDGSLRPIPNAILDAEVALQNNIATLVVPTANAQQAALVDGVAVVAASSLREIFLHLTKATVLPTQQSAPVITAKQDDSTLMGDVKGQEQAKRALLIAASGRHNILLSGPPGAGKTMLARALVSLLPPLTHKEVIEVTKLYSMAGRNPERVVATRPFRTPHHSASHVALTGGGSQPRPGEISLAHRGVLFLDELPEYSRSALEALRQPLEDKCISIARANDTVRFPADFMLVATQNPCPCGFAGDPHHECTCRLHQLQQYQKKISGPLLDRIDMVIEVARVGPEELLTPSQTAARETQQLRKMVSAALALQRQRFKNMERTNANITSRELQTLAALSPDAQQLLEKAARSLNLSARGYFKVIKVGRTIADLEAKESILPSHISEALQYRPRTG